MIELQYFCFFFGSYVKSKYEKHKQTEFKWKWCTFNIICMIQIKEINMKENEKQKAAVKNNTNLFVLKQSVLIKRLNKKLISFFFLFCVAGAFWTLAATNICWYFLIKYFRGGQSCFYQYALHFVNANKVRRNFYRNARLLRFIYFTIILENLFAFIWDWDLDFSIIVILITIVNFQGQSKIRFVVSLVICFFFFVFSSVKFEKQ